MTRALVGVFGAGRNGSTLLVRLLDGSPDLWAYPIELNYLAVRRLLSEDGGRWWAESQLEELRETYVAELAEPVVPAVDPLLEYRRAAGDDPEANALALLEAVERAYAPGGAGERTLLFKSTEVTEIPRYGGLFPGLRFLHIVREPLANYASLKRTTQVAKEQTFWAHGDLLRVFLEERWLPHVRFFLEACERDPARHRLVRYEDLVAAPERVVPDLCAWLDARPPADPAELTALGGRRLRRFVSGATSRGEAVPPRVAGPAEANDGVVTPRERDFIAARTGPLAERLGYGVPAGAPRALLAARWLPPDRWELRHARSPLRLAKALAERRAYVWSRLLRNPPR